MALQNTRKKMQKIPSRMISTQYVRTYVNAYGVRSGRRKWFEAASNRYMQVHIQSLLAASFQLGTWLVQQSALLGFTDGQENSNLNYLGSTIKIKSWSRHYIMLFSAYSARIYT